MGHFNTTHNDMKLKELFIGFYLVIILLMIILIVSSIFMYHNNVALVHSYESRHKSFLIAEELRKSSDNLTTYCRTYVETGDSAWEKKYWKVLNIRDGKEAWENGRKISMRDSMRSLGFTNAELDKLKVAEQNSNNLVWTERVAFNALKGLFADSSGQFISKEKPDTQMARQIMFDSKYQTDKATIMQPIDECIRMVENRTQYEVENSARLNKRLLLFIIILIITVSTVVLISYFLIRGRITLQFNELQKAKEKAEHSEEKFRVFFEKSPEMITITSLQGNFIDCNPANLNFQGVQSVDELKQTNVESLYVNKHERIELREDLFKNKHVRNKEVKFRSIRSNLEIDCLISCELIKTLQNETVIISWIRDISEKVKAQNTILKLHTAVSQSPAAIVITDLSGKIEYANQQFSTITGYSVEEVIGKNPRVLKSGVHPKEFYKDMWDTVLLHKTWNGEIYNKRKDGSFFWEAATIAPILNDRREIINIVAIKQDIQAEFALLENQKKLTELNEVKNKLFSIIGHDLRGPIGNLKSIIEVLINDENLADPQDLKTIMEGLRSSTSATYDLLENLLLWAKSQQNEVVFMPSKINLYQVAETTILLLNDMASKKSISVFNRIPQDFVVRVDKNMIMTVIRNLLSNALKFTNIDKNIYLSATEVDLTFSISVKDEGIGMSHDDIKKLFNPTTNHSTFGTSGEKGTGLGLLLCKDFVERHKGNIRIESELGKGSEFTVSIPKISENEI